MWLNSTAVDAPLVHALEDGRLDGLEFRVWGLGFGVVNGKYLPVFLFLNCIPTVFLGFPFGVPMFAVSHNAITLAAFPYIARKKMDTKTSWYADPKP